MPAVEVKPGIYWIGVNDRTTDLFEGIWPVTNEGVSYNAYLVKGQKNAIIDMAKDMKSETLLEQISEIIDPSDIDYIIINHMEPDHTGVLRTIKRISPQAEIYCTQRAYKLIVNFYSLSDNIHTVSDGEILDLGTHRLQFFITPMVHWPETMVTYEQTHKVLFSCDAFGGYGALQGTIFDDQCSEPEFYEREALRYYANIVSMFPRPVIKAIDKIKDIPIDVVAPSHGLIWREKPERIIELYKQWANYALEGPEIGVTLVYGTMYGNTEQMVEAVAKGVNRAGLPISIFDVRHRHASYILPSLYTHNGVIIGAPTYEAALFPPMAHLLDIVERKHIRNRKLAYFGSYGWNGGAEKEITQWAEDLRWELVETMAFPGGAPKELLRQGESLGYRFANALK
jgi:anaerobic nitric oxide reductase flavorubredoxin